MLSEPHIIERIEAAKEKARHLVDGDYDDEESLLYVLRWKLCLARGWGFFDPYFKDRTLDDLVFENEMIRLSSQSSTSRGSEVLSSASVKERESLFDDWADADTKIVDQKFDEDAKKFMETGEFK